jgi:hypothetical protein
MPKLLPVLACVGMLLTAFQLPAKAETWWLVVVADSRGPTNGPLFWPISLESEKVCLADGAEMMALSKEGIFDQVNVSPFGFKCIQVN